MVPTSWKTVLQFLKMVNIHLPLDPGIPLLEKKKKAYVCMKTYRWMFTAVLKVMAKNWNQPWHPSAGEWSPNGSVFIQWVQLNNEKDWPIDIGCSQQHRWPCTQSKKPDQKKKKNSTYCMIPFICNSRKCKEICNVRKQICRGGKQEWL